MNLGNKSALAAETPYLSVTDEKAALEEPPAYEDLHPTTDVSQPAVELPSERDAPAYETTIPTNSSADQASPVPPIAQNLQRFQHELLAFRSGSRNGRELKRLARTIVDDLYTAEINRRVNAHGRLGCGERSQVWREIKPLKHNLRSLIGQVKAERQ